MRNVDGLEDRRCVFESDARRERKNAKGTWNKEVKIGEWDLVVVLPSPSQLVKTADKFTLDPSLTKLPRWRKLFYPSQRHF